MTFVNSQSVVWKPFLFFFNTRVVIQTREHSHIRNISFSVFDTSMNSKVNFIQIQFMKVKRLLGHHRIKRLICKLVWVESVEINFQLLIYSYRISGNSFLPWIVVEEKSVLCRWICRYCDNYLKYVLLIKKNSGNTLCGLIQRELEHFGYLLCTYFKNAFGWFIKMSY